MNEKINKKLDIPFHHQLYLSIKHRIETGLYKEGDLIPSEQEMQKEYGVSRTTVRRTITDLEHDGLVKKIKGKGTIVLPKKSNRDLYKFTSFSGDAITRGDNPSSVILEIKTIEAPSKVVEMLKIDPGDNVTLLKRLRLINGRIIALNMTYVRIDMGFEIKNNDFDETTSLYDFLESQNIVLGSADETIEAKMPSPEVKSELFMEDDIPIFYKERVTFTDKGEPIEYSENSYIANRYKYNIKLTKARE